MVTIRAYTYNMDEDKYYVSYFDDINEKSIKFTSGGCRGDDITFNKAYDGNGFCQSFTVFTDYLLSLQILENYDRLTSHDDGETVIVR